MTEALTILNNWSTIQRNVIEPSQRNGPPRRKHQILTACPQATSLTQTVGDVWAEIIKYCGGSLKFIAINTMITIYFIYFSSAVYVHPLEYLQLWKKWMLFTAVYKLGAGGSKGLSCLISGGEYVVEPGFGLSLNDFKASAHPVTL